MVASLLRSLLVSLLLTLALELAASFLLGVRSRRDFLLVFLVNVVTNPVAGLIFDGVWLSSGRMPRWYLVLAMEVAAVCVEALLYRGRLHYQKLRPILFSLVLNCISYLGGVIYGFLR